ncbi:MAG: type II secretion system F family protein [Thermodesulfovibrionales bacterium]
MIGLGIFALTSLLLYESSLVIKTLWNPEARAVRRRLRALSSGSFGGAVDIVKKRTLSTMPWLNRLLLQVKGIERLERLLDQADSPYPLGAYLFLSLVLGLSGAFALSFFTGNGLLLAVSGFVPAAAPWWYLLLKRKGRMEKFYRQLPDALDLVARALRAGHAFSGGLKLVSEEFDDPISVEFEAVMNEINFGVGVPEALKNLTERVDCPDLRFFVVSVIVQRETGGNLAEILETLAHLIRERFKLLNRVRILSAEGRFSAAILIAIPFLVAFAVHLTKPNYIKVLLTDPAGHLLIAVALGGMVVGVLTMKKMITIRV